MTTNSNSNSGEFTLDDAVSHLKNMFGDDLSNVEARTGPKKLPPGQVVMRIENVFTNTSSRLGRKQLNIQCSVLWHEHGEGYVGYTYVRSWGLEDKESFEYLKGALVNLGLGELKTPQDLKRIAKDAIGIVFKGVLLESRNPSYPPTLFIPEDSRNVPPALGATPKKEGDDVAF